jgi:hypothetical protein
MRAHARLLALATGLVCLLPATGLSASFPATDVYLPSVGRGGGSGGSQWYTTTWIHNPGTTSANVQVFFLKRDQANPSPQVYNLTVQGGDTVRTEDAITAMFGGTGFGALHVVSDQKLVVNSRIYSKPAGGDLKNTVGQLFAAVPAGFAIASGQSTTLLGVYQTAPQADSQFRYNFGLVETAGSSATVRVTAYDETGLSVSSKNYELAGYEARQYNITDLLPGVNSSNLRLAVEVLSGSGKVVAFGSGLANKSNDPSTFEMSYDEQLLGGGGIAAVTAGQGLTGGGSSGSVTLDVGAGAGISVTADAIAIATGGVTTGMLADAAVSTAKLAGNAVTTSTIADSSVGSAKLIDGGIGPQDLAAGAVTLPKIAASGATAGKVLSNDGSNLTWQSSGLTLPYDGSSTSAASAFKITSTGTSLEGIATEGYGVRGTSSGQDGVFGESTQGSKAGVWGRNASGRGVLGQTTSGTGVRGESVSGRGVIGASTSEDGVQGITSGASKSGVWGLNNTAANGYGVYGSNSGTGTLGYLGGVYGAYGNGGSGRGVMGESTSAAGVYGKSTSAAGVNGESTSGWGVSGTSTSNDGVVGTTSASGKSGVWGSSTNGFGVTGSSTSDSGVQAVTSSSNPNTGALWARNLGAGPALYAQAGSGGYAAVLSGRTRTSVLEITGGSDLSEQFDIRGLPDERAQPGMVVAIDAASEGGLVIARHGYDRSVAGVISGAGGIRPGMLMGQTGSAANGDQPVALSGRVYCWADAAFGAIAPGDLLTSSETPGHAMRVADHARAQGAVLGKAMSALPSGRGLVLVLVALQ